MPKVPGFLGIHARPGFKLNILLALLPFLLLVGVYFFGSYYRLSINPDDKLLPSLPKMVNSVIKYAFTPDEDSGKLLMLDDTLSSLARIGTGILLSSSIGLFIGLYMGIFRGFKSLSLSFVNFISIIPPLAILPILFITFGVGDIGKIMLIFIGTCPMIIRDIYITVKKIPEEMITKSLTLGAKQHQIPWKIIFPQILPKLIDSVRLSLGAAWVYLIASESIASTNGLGYRIFLVRRYLAMDVIIPYVVWITLIGFLIDFGLIYVVKSRFPWYHKD
ncbi:MAG: ABC transporter permease subunit [Spirochaetales bacterium]|nr:ABC transporter permease subunit [Spirochaetales bacterium]